jgi:D-sedoheptulose 7-phosphate isomerase
VDIRAYFESVQTLLNNIPFDVADQAADAVMQAYDADQTIYICGNGGSAATASHFGCDLSKRTRVPGQRYFRVISLTDNVSLMTALSNDIGYDIVFAEQLRPLVRAGDVVIGISGSGNSLNVLKAMEVAQSAGATTIGFSGYDGGKLAPLVDISVHVPSFNMAMVEDVHLMLEHAMCERLLAQVQARVAAAV